MTILRTGRTSRTTNKNDKNDKKRRSGGMTLLEVLLVVAILVSLIGATAIGLRVFSSRRGVQGAVERFAVALRMARAEAVNRGKRIRLIFDEETGGEILIETDPLGSPGQFVEYAGCTWKRHLADERLRVISSQLIGQGALSSAESPGYEGDDKKRQPVTFSAEGSCDSAEISLAARNETDPRRFTVTLDGMSGKTTIKEQASDN